MSDSVWPERIATGVAFLFALAFLGAGGAKLAQAQFELDAFEKFGLPIYSMLLAGAFEVVAAGLLIWRKGTTLGCIIGAGIMIVAIFAHLHADEVPQAVVPVAFTLGFVWLGLRRRKDFAGWIGG